MNLSFLLQMRHRAVWLLAVLFVPAVLCAQLPRSPISILVVNADPNADKSPSRKSIADFLPPAFEFQGSRARASTTYVPINDTTNLFDQFFEDVGFADLDLIVFDFANTESSRLVSSDYLRFRLEAWINSIKSKNIRVVVLLPVPRPRLNITENSTEPDSLSHRKAQTAQAEFTQTIKDIALGLQVLLVDVTPALLEYAETPGQNVGVFYTLDGSPNDTATRLAADVAADVICRTYFWRGSDYQHIPQLDLDADSSLHVVVDREKGQYLGHPTTVLLEDGETVLTVYPTGHGAGGVLYKRSTDGGRSWSERLPVPENWADSKEVPTIYRTVDRAGKKRLIMFSGLYPIKMAVSADDGLSWSLLEPIGDFGGIVAMASLARTSDGDYLAFFHDDGRFLTGSGERTNKFWVYQTRSRDGGLTWSAPTGVVTHETAHLCEPGLIVSPDGKTWALLLRENSRKHRSFVIFSRDEGVTWTIPTELPATLTGDRHTGKYTNDGRLFISFRDMGPNSDTKGDWIGWIGTWDDLLYGRQGQYRVRIKDNKNAWDSTYPGVEVLPDGTILTTTYGHWDEGEAPYILSARLNLADLDQRVLNIR